MPQFPRTDPASPEFWEMRYQAEFTPWDVGAVPRQLAEYLAANRPHGRVLVPGCGSGHDVRFMAEAGLNVRGIDFSEAALAMARPVLGPFARHLQQADFFGPELAGTWSMIYEKAFLCALPRRRWSAWATRVTTLLAPGGHLVGFFHFDQGDRGPPFALHDQSELDALLGANFGQVEDFPVRDSIPAFAGKERWQVWLRK
jgi:SAM-dependent methyltransferase